MEKSLGDKIRQIVSESSKGAREKRKRDRNENSKLLDSYLETAHRGIISKAKGGGDCYFLEISDGAPFIRKLCGILNGEGLKAEYSKGHRSGSVSIRDDCNPISDGGGSSGYDYVNLWVRW